MKIHEEVYFGRFKTMKKQICRNIFGVFSPDFMRKAYNFTRTDFIINYCVIAFPTLTLIALTHSGEDYNI